MTKVTIDDEMMVADVPGYEGLYKVTSDGQVFSKRRAKYLNTQNNGNGYKFVYLSKDNTRTKFYIHRLVAEVFVPRANESYDEIHHLDGNRENNDAANLVWVDRLEHNKLHKGKAVEQYDLVSGKTIAEYDTIRAAAASTNVLASGISLCCNGKQRSAGGYGWKFKEDKEDRD